MNKQPESIPKQPIFKPTEDYYRLRREGVGFIADMGSRLWTDYNTHDSGITMLESLCYAITDLAYRTGWDIKDILAPETRSIDLTQPYPNQTFFTAREILTVNPCTTDDFRRLLVDLDGVRNAWLFCKQCPCDFTLFAWCDEDKQFALGYQKPPLISESEISRVQPQGLYDVLLELETDQELGDLNDHKIMQTFVIFDEGSKQDSTAHILTMELRFPARKFLEQTTLNDLADLSKKDIKIERIKMLRLTPDKYDDAEIVDEEELKKGWQGVFYTSLEIKWSGITDPMTIHNVAVRFFGDKTVKERLQVKEKTEEEDQLQQYCIQTYLQESSDTGFVYKYREKINKAKAQINEAKKVLNNHRNLDEDYCDIKVVDIEDVAVCADIEIKPDADIERIQALIWLEIENYLNPPVPFYTLQELEKAEVPTETIFNGPKLNNGFLKAEDLQAAKLRTVLHTSDIISRLMDIEDVVSVNYLSLTKYDAEGHAVKGQADPKEESGFDPNKISAAWQLYVSENHQPRFNRNLSRFLFLKDGLPFMPRMGEALDTLMQLRGKNERPKIKNKNAYKDFAIPAGKFREPEDYYPVQYGFPLTYGIGPEGLPSHVSDTRRAQAKQMKAYLLVFEQLLGNALAQLAHTADLFSLDTEIRRTYFVREFNENQISGYNELIDRLDRSALESMTETSPEFLQRRNRFLNHLMARFGEQFGEYALLLSDIQGRQVVLDRLIKDKISFLKAYPIISHDRGKAFNYTENTRSPDNVPGLKRRIGLLLGNPELSWSWQSGNLTDGQKELPQFQLKDRNDQIWFEIKPPHELANTVKDIVKAEKKGKALESYEILYKSGKLEAKPKGKKNNPPEQDSLLSSENSKKLKSKLGECFRIATNQIIESNVMKLESGPDQTESGTVQFRIKLTDKDGDIGQSPETIKSKAEGLALQEKLLNWGANERLIIVEHLLLRPKFPGDALYPVCIDGDCLICGDEDHYSFRLTVVMPGWTTLYNENMEMRKFAERTIRQETPSHLLCKICWVDNKARSGKLFERFEAAWYSWLEANEEIDWIDERLQENLEAILLNKLVHESHVVELEKNELSRCAAAILTNFGMLFYKWLDDQFEEGEVFNSLNFDEFNAGEIKLCDGLKFETDTVVSIQNFLRERYKNYVVVSYRLKLVLKLLSNLYTVYPAATLHDCDEGNDENPVRLGMTALGAIDYPSSETF